MGLNDLNYLPPLTKENAVLLGNKSIYHVKKDSLEYAIKKGFEPKDVELAKKLIEEAIEENNNRFYKSIY